MKNKASKGAKGFGQFIQQKESGSQKKERIRQEKKQDRQVRQAYFEEKKNEARAQRKAQRDSYQPLKENQAPTPGEHGAQKGKGAGFRKGGVKRAHGYGAKKEFEAAKEQRVDKQRPYAKKTTYNNKRRQDEENIPAENNFKATPARKVTAPVERAADGKRERKPIASRAGGFRKEDSKKSFGSADGQSAFGAKRSAATGRTQAGASAGSRAATGPKTWENKSAANKATDNAKTTGAKAPATAAKAGATKSPAAITKATAPAAAPASGKGSSEQMPLNKYIAHSGVCSRRDAADIVKSGKVVVNGQAILEPGFKVSGQDEIKVNGKKISARRNMVYILLNKPKDYITTTEDPQGRKTVLDIIRNATPERVYPIGRLDRNTTGVLLLTNDGELAQKLAHPSYEVKKIYEVTLDKPLVKKDFDAILSGVQLEDGFIAPDVLAYADSKDKSVIGIEIHSGRNRIVRRIFEHMGYDVRNLDRVMYANLTKKNVERGKWRFLSEKEVRLLKFLNASYTNKNKTARRG
ncbi:MAG: pseudouridine synthase [Candidatus Pseudobacter hemicellulosilyticus]|uniref:Pseudouridine synthase n=1 Tax=Candidatus Pseudobacter hemicellulosilyticus TaxID=3121375 RepID=A0AAJ5WSH3_9BACT|nr:MAG: pseudouridine synthase [Pseudobacter sp.]